MVIVHPDCSDLHRYKCQRIGGAQAFLGVFWWPSNQKLWLSVARDTQLNKNTTNVRVFNRPLKPLKTIVLRCFRGFRGLSIGPPRCREKPVSRIAVRRIAAKLPVWRVRRFFLSRWWSDWDWIYVFCYRIIINAIALIMFRLFLRVNLYEHCTFNLEWSLRNIVMFVYF